MICPKCKSPNIEVYEDNAYPDGGGSSVDTRVRCYDCGFDDWYDRYVEELHMDDEDVNLT